MAAPAGRGGGRYGTVSATSDLRLVGDRAQFVVRTDDPGFRGALRELAFAQEDESSFVRSFPFEAPGLQESYLRFKVTLEEMLGQAAGRRIPPWEEALDAVARRLRPLHANWFLTGSAALAVRGIDVVPRDLDLVAAEAATIADGLGDVLIEPVSASRPGTSIARYTGRGFLRVRIEWLAEVDPAVDVYASPNEHGPEAASRLEAVRWADHELSLVPVDLQLAVAERRGLQERAEAIRDYLLDRRT
jgi:hypothetical protein